MCVFTRIQVDQLLKHTVKSPHCFSLAYDELSRIIQERGLHDSVVDHISAHISELFEELFAEEGLVEGGKLVSSTLPSLNHNPSLKGELWMNLDGEDSEIAIDLLGRSARSRQDAQALVSIPSSFRLLRSCEYFNGDGNLQHIDGLVGVPLLMLKQMYLRDFADLDEPVKNVHIFSVFNAINFVREILNSFILSDWEGLRGKLCARLRNLILLEHHLRECLRQHPHFDPVVSLVEDSPSLSSSASASVSASSASSKKKSASMKSKKKRESEDVDKTFNFLKSHFHPLDIEVCFLLNTNLRLTEKEKKSARSNNNDHANNDRGDNGALSDSEMQDADVVMRPDEITLISLRFLLDRLSLLFKKVLHPPKFSFLRSSTKGKSKQSTKNKGTALPLIRFEPTINDPSIPSESLALPIRFLQTILPIVPSLHTHALTLLNNLRSGNASIDTAVGADPNNLSIEMEAEMEMEMHIELTKRGLTGTQTLDVLVQMVELLISILTAPAVQKDSVDQGVSLHPRADLHFTSPRPLTCRLITEILYMFSTGEGATHRNNNGGNGKDDIDDPQSKLIAACQSTFDFLVKMMEGVTNFQVNVVIINALQILIDFPAAFAKTESAASSHALINHPLIHQLKISLSTTAGRLLAKEWPAKTAFKAKTLSYIVRTYIVNAEVPFERIESLATDVLPSLANDDGGDSGSSSIFAPTLTKKTVHLYFIPILEELVKLLKKLPVNNDQFQACLRQHIHNARVFMQLMKYCKKHYNNNTMLSVALKQVR